MTGLTWTNGNPPAWRWRRRTPHLRAPSSVGIFPVLNRRRDALGYPLAQSVAEYGCTLNLPGSVITPARFVADPAISRNPRPGCRHRQPPCRPGRRRCGPRSQTTIAASCNAFPASMVAAGSPAAWAVSSRNAAHHNPDSGSGLAPATPAQGCCWGCQLAAARCSLAAAVIASAAANSSRSRAASWSEGGPSSPDPRRARARLPYRTAALANCSRVRVCAFRSSRNAGSAHWLTPRSVSPSQIR